MKLGVKKGNFKFYSFEEISEISEQLKKGRSAQSISEYISFKSGRGLGATKDKVSRIKKQLNAGMSILEIATRKVNKNKNVTKNTSLPVTEKTNVGVQVPLGMTFEGVPKKIILCSDHFKIYF